MRRKREKVDGSHSPRDGCERICGGFESLSLQQKQQDSDNKTARITSCTMSPRAP